MAKHLKADGTERVLEPANGVMFTLEELQSVVGGYIEVLFLDTGERLVLNEQGKIQHLKINQAATRLARAHAGVAPYDYVVGDVLVGSRREVV